MQTRAEAHHGYAEAMAACKGDEALLKAACRELAKRDLFYLLVYVLDRDDVDRDWLFDRCREVQARPDGCLDLWAREHYKSTIITFALTIQDILNDPEVTVGIFSHVNKIAKDFLKQIKRELESNEALKALFPEILWADPVKEAPSWSEDSGIIVKRKNNPNAATVEANGLVDGMPTGKHYSVLVYDDVVTEKSVTTPEMIKKVTDAWELSLSLGVADGGKRRTIGTRYHYNDTYGTMLERESAVPRVYSVTEDGKVDGEPVLLTREQVKEIRSDRGPYTFACQYLLDPKADSTMGFLEDWLAVWPAVHTNNLNNYILVDPASGKKKDSGDYTAMWCVGIGADDNYYVVDMLRDRLNPTERIDRLFAWHRRYRPLAVAYEDYGMQADIHNIQERMKKENYRFTLVPVGGRMAKPDRIRRMVPLFEASRIILPETCWRENLEGVMEDLTQTFIRQEYLPFPVGAHDDMLDALSRLHDISMQAPGGGAAANNPQAETDYNMMEW